MKLLLKWEKELVTLILPNTNSKDELYGFSENRIYNLTLFQNQFFGEDFTEDLLLGSTV